ncbi:MAG TPA: Xaa-Pro aminopeptidase [Pyrinomonadaceae bacterium]|nr:Xaa-Pro aminopeptidase [Pyrinomonadaceae bacterium]
MVFAVVVAAALLAAPLRVATGAQTARAKQAQVESIRTTPPAPVFDENERRAELSARRARVAREIGASGVLVLLSAEPRLYTGDVDYHYRQENNLFYLTHLRQRGATLVLLPGHAALREILFLPRRNAQAETWTGAMYSAEDARRISGIGEIWDSKEFAPFMQSLGKREPFRPKPENVLLSQTLATNTPAAAVNPSNTSVSNPQTSANGVHGFESLYAAAARNEAALYLLVPLRDADTGAFGDAREWRREQRLAEQWKTSASGFQIRSAFHIFSDMRVRKSASEIQRMQHAIDITTEALGRAMASAGQAKWEYEVAAEIDYVFKLRNADSHAYPSIVGAGANATTIHYEDSQGRVSQGDLLLMDVGAEYEHYAADITRTFPVSGRFSSAQADIYNIVLAAQDAAIAAARPGATLSEVHNAALNIIKDGLLRLGLITDRNSSQYFQWFPHATSHWLGMNAHDIGYGNVKLEAGMTFTIEPGIYVRADALEHLSGSKESEKYAAAIRPAFEKYKNIGVRIEDDILITPEGARVLSSALPRTIPEIEYFITRNARELR